MHTTTKKIEGSALRIANKISRILKKNGFERVNTNCQRLQGEGFYVHRAGYSSTVHVDYHTFDYPIEEKRFLRQSKIAQMREVLFELGYVSSHPKAIYIECTES
jgi:hypothetical protein